LFEVEESQTGRCAEMVVVGPGTVVLGRVVLKLPLLEIV
jgi:hypothetical protein